MSLLSKTELAKPKLASAVRVPSHFAEIAKKFPNVITIYNEPDRLVNWDKSDLKSELLDWFATHVHGQWTWDVALSGKLEEVEVDSGKKVSLTDETIKFLFFFEKQTDAVFFRLAHSY